MAKLSKGVPYTKIEAELKATMTQEAIEIDEDAPAAIVRAPVGIGPLDNTGVFIPVSDLPSLDDLPFISERLRDFAFRYATEGYRSRAQWAKEYGVAVSTVNQWLSHKGVRAYIAVARYEQRTYALAQRVSMNRRVYKKMGDILDTRITADTIGPIVSLLKFLYKILNDPDSAAGRSKGAFNLSVGVNTAPPVENAYAQRPELRDVTPKEIGELKRDIEELEMMASDLGVEV